MIFKPMGSKHNAGSNLPQPNTNRSQTTEDTSWTQVTCKAKARQLHLLQDFQQWPCPTFISVCHLWKAEGIGSHEQLDDVDRPGRQTQLQSWCDHTFFWGSLWVRPPTQASPKQLSSATCFQSSQLSNSVQYGTCISRSTFP